MYILKGFCDTKGNTLLNFSNKVAVYPDEAIKSSWNSHSSLEIRSGTGQNIDVFVSIFLPITALPYGHFALSIY